MSNPPDDGDGPDDDGPDDGPADAIDTAIDNAGAEVAGDATRRKRRRRRRRRDHGGDPASAPIIPNQADAPTREGLAAEAPQDGGPRAPAPLDGEFAPAAPGDRPPPQQQQRDPQRHRDPQRQQDPQRQRDQQRQQDPQRQRDQQQQRGRDDRGRGRGRDDRRESRGGDNRQAAGDNRQPGGDNRGGENRGGENRGGENRGGENRGGENRGGENRGGENRGGENRGGANLDFRTDRAGDQRDANEQVVDDNRELGSDNRPAGSDNRDSDNRQRGSANQHSRADNQQPRADNQQPRADNRANESREGGRRRRRDRRDGRGDGRGGREHSEGRGAPRDQEPGGEADLREAADDILRGDPYRDGDVSGAIESRGADNRGDRGDRGDSRDRDNRGGESRGGDNRDRENRAGESRGGENRDRDARGDRAARPSQPNLGGDSRRQTHPGAGDVPEEEDRVTEPTVAWGTDDGQPAPDVTLAADLPVDAPDDDPDPLTYPLVDGPGAGLGDDVASVVGIRFVPAGRIQWCDAGDAEFVPGERVMVDSDRGPRLAWIATSPQRRATRERNLRRVMRRANDVDLRGELAGEHDRKELLRLAKDKAAQLRLPLKVFRVEKAGQKLNVYYTSDERLDLREFVRDVGTATGLRLELRQLGVRDEAKMVGGIGSCGLTLCCTTWLPDFVPVSIKMAKDQGLVLSPTKVSGQCGRLKCCLVYEQAGYAEMRKGLPKLGKRVISPKGEGRVVEVDVLRQRIRVSYGPGDTEVLPASEVKPMFPSGQQQQHRDEPDDDDAEPDLPQS